MTTAEKPIVNFWAFTVLLFSIFQFAVPLNAQSSSQVAGSKIIKEEILKGWEEQANTWRKFQLSETGVYQSLNRKGNWEPRTKFLRQYTATGDSARMLAQELILTGGGKRSFMEKTDAEGELLIASIKLPFLKSQEFREPADFDIQYTSYLQVFTKAPITDARTDILRPIGFLIGESSLKATIQNADYRVSTTDPINGMECIRLSSQEGKTIRDVVLCKDLNYLPILKRTEGVEDDGTWSESSLEMSEFDSSLSTFKLTLAMYSKPNKNSSEFTNANRSISTFVVQRDLSDEEASRLLNETAIALEEGFDVFQSETPQIKKTMLPDRRVEKKKSAEFIQELDSLAEIKTYNPPLHWYQKLEFQLIATCVVFGIAAYWRMAGKQKRKTG